MLYKHEEPLILSIIPYAAVVMHNGGLAANPMGYTTGVGYGKLRFILGVVQAGGYADAIVCSGIVLGH